jgi:hypothetical protein
MDPQDVPPDATVVSGTARLSRYDGRFRLNPGGEARTLDEAIAIARRHDIELDPEEYRLVVDPIVRSDYARYFDLANLNAGSSVSWRQLTASDGRIVIRIQRHTLTSDEAILAALAHEYYETQRLREEFVRQGGKLSAALLQRLVEPSDISLHNAAWDFADALLDQLRSEDSTP